MRESQVGSEAWLSYGATTPQFGGKALLVRQELLPALKQTDAVILDIDGVLLDVADTFRVVICEATHFFFKRALRWVSDGKLITPEETELLKHAGGFNNDWDLTQAVTLLYIWKSITYNTTKTEQLRQEAPTLEAFADEIEHRGGGLAAAEACLLADCAPRLRREVTALWDRRAIIQIFKELYAGKENCQALYGFEPQWTYGEGYIHKERVLIDPDTLPRSVRKVGILTGRCRSEALLALQRTRLAGRIDPRHILTSDDGVEKPAPRALWMLTDRMGVRNGLYIGDTLDDYRMVLAFRDLRASAHCNMLSCLVLTGPSGVANQTLFIEKGAEIVAPNVNAFLTYLGCLLGRSGASS